MNAPISRNNLKEALQCIEDDHENRPIYIGSLGFSQFKRYECLHELTDIHLKPAEGYSIGQKRQRSRFERLGRLTDLMDSILNLQKAVESVKDGDPTKLRYLSSLCSSQHRRFERLGGPKDIADCISNLHKVVQSTADGNPDKPSALGSGQLSRYEHLSELIDLEESISNQLKAVQLTKDEHRHKPGYLTNLSISQLRLYERLGNQTILERSFLNLQKPVQLTSHSHPAGDGHASQPVYRSNLGLSQLKRYEWLGGLVDLENAISNLQQAVQLTDDRHPDKSLCLANLGVGQQRRFDAMARWKISHSISNLQSAVWLTDDVRPDKSTFLSNLGLGHLKRHERLGDPTDIEDSILNLHQLVKDGHPDKPMVLSNLSISHMKRYERLGELTDIQDAISNLHIRASQCMFPTLVSAN
ncbi:hypothetical protein PILCRDRAFT_86352 [Piloderma croceum F 1598]|uniref:Uncharacterized protein n=1 Tax=Piloderma croceum (strain F 1598) TaxID=765440 RepID=A0A0C3BJX6_PILCF|nr:hypothetical protein PILCRDRAFT_86352 [Piloderma croceum F 1598]